MYRDNPVFGPIDVNFNNQFYTFFPYNTPKFINFKVFIKLKRNLVSVATVSLNRTREMNI